MLVYFEGKFQNVLTWRHVKFNQAENNSLYDNRVNENPQSIYTKNY